MPTLMNGHFGLIRSRGFESLAAADRRDDQVQGRVHRVPALFHQVVRRLLRCSNLNQLRLILLAVLAEMDAQTTLSVVNLHHVGLLNIAILLREECNARAVDAEIPSQLLSRTYTSCPR